jgi:hypothetical protein
MELAGIIGRKFGEYFNYIQYGQAFQLEGVVL